MDSSFKILLSKMFFDTIEPFTFKNMIFVLKLLSDDLATVFLHI